jgi:hypothetical protein
MEHKVTVREIKIANPSGGFYVIKIDISKTVYELREQISMHYGIDINKFKFKIGSNVIADDVTIESSGILTGSVTFSYIRMSLTVTTPDGQVVIVQINPNDKVISLRTMIHTQTGWPLDRFTLVKGTGEVLVDDKSFATQGITFEGYTIAIRFIQVTEVTFTIATPQGKTFSVTTTL